MQTEGRVTRFLARAPAPVFVGWAIVASFSTYFCMYAFRYGENLERLKSIKAKYDPANLFLGAINITPGPSGLT